MNLRRASAIAALAALTALHFGGAAGVPFHPDESSLLYQSRDLELYLDDPRSMAWSEAGREEKDQQYRALNAPLPKYVLGLGRALAGHGEAAVAVDWDWSESWDFNRVVGALPKPGVLLPARFASTALVSASLPLIYLVGRRLGGAATGLVAAALLGLNALVLLHGRRAMAEGTLLFTVALALWGILLGERKPWLAGLATALAFSTKHSALVLIPIGGLSILWMASPAARPNRWNHHVARVGLFLASAAAVIVAANPLLWSNPMASAVEILRSRQALVEAQLRAQAQHSPVQLPMAGADRLSALIAHVFLTPVQFEEIPNYAEQLAPSIAAYRRNPSHGLLRGWFAGGLVMGLTLAGLLIGLTRLRHGTAAARREIGLLALTTISQTVALLLVLPFPYQRYYMPLVPLYSLWSAYALVQILGIMQRLPWRRAA